MTESERRPLPTSPRPARGSVGRLITATPRPTAIAGLGGLVGLAGLVGGVGGLLSRVGPGAVPTGPDGPWFAWVQAALDGGLVPYRDFFVLHGPPYYVLHVARAAVGLDGPEGAWATGFAILIGLAVATAGLAVRALPRPRGWAEMFVATIISATLVLAWGPGLEFAAVGARPKHLALAVLGLAALTTARPGGLAALATGALLALAAATWQPAVIPAAALALVRLRRGPVAIAGSELAAGALLVGGVLVVGLAATGLLEACFRQAVEFPLRYQERPAPPDSRWHLGAWPGPAAPIAVLLMHLDPEFLLVAVVGLVGFLLLPSAGEDDRPASDDAASARRSIVGLLVGGAVLTMFVCHGPGYVLPLLVPLAAATGAAAGHLSRRLGPMRVLPFAFLVAAGLLVGGRRAAPDRVLGSEHDFTSIADEILPPCRVLILGDPALRYASGPPTAPPPEHDVQWVFGRKAALAARHPGGVAAWVGGQLAEADLVAVIVTERASGMVPAIEAAIDAIGGWERVEAFAVDGAGEGGSHVVEPAWPRIWRRREPSPGGAREGAG